MKWWATRERGNGTCALWRGPFPPHEGPFGYEASAGFDVKFIGDAGDSILPGLAPGECKEIEPIQIKLKTGNADGGEGI